MSFEKRTASWVLTKAFQTAQRKSTPPAIGSSKYGVLLSLIDSEQKNWEAEPDVEWESLYQLVNNGNATLATVYDLDSTIEYITNRKGDVVRIGNSEFKIVNNTQLYEYRYENAVAQNGQSLVFSRAMDASLVGKPIYVPSYITLEDITLASDVVQVDNPMYLVYMVAAEYVSGDPVKSGKYDNLVAKAQNIMTKMKQTNMAQEEKLITSGWSADGMSWI